jgi:hypothetical protein
MGAPLIAYQMPCRSLVNAQGILRCVRRAGPEAEAARRPEARIDETRPATARNSALRDAMRQYRLAKAQQEESKLAKMRGETIELAVVERRCFEFFRLIRNRLTDWVSRAAPIIAAKAKADEGAVWRAMSEEMRNLQTELSSLDLERAIADMEQDQSADEEEETDSAP